MATVNIRRDVQDGFYRYKMPVLLTKVEGRGNGIKTVIPNMADVARALNRPASYPTKFFGHELGAQATFNDVTEKYIVNGVHESGRLRELLDVFIDKFVLCPSCKNPETELVILKDETIIRDCKACGKRVSLDMKHRLTVFILKNPPKSTKKGAGKKGAAGADSLPVVAGSDGDTDDELTKKIEAGATELLSPEQAAALIAANEDDDEWSIDTSKEAVAARIASLDSKLQASLVLDDEDEDSMGGQYDAFGEWVKENRETATDAEIFLKAEEVGLAKKHKILIVLVQALFTEAIAKEIPAHAGLFKKLTTSEKHQKSLLGGIERLVGVTFPEMNLKVEIPKILMAFYQAEILEEDVVTHWGTHASKKYVPKDISKRVRKAADPFVKWLAEASDDEEEDEDDE